MFISNWIKLRFYTQQEGTRKYFVINMLQNSMSHTRPTVLYFINIQQIAEPHLIQESRFRLEQTLLGNDYAGGR